MSDLLPCPFCGGFAAASEWPNARDAGYTWGVGCSGPACMVSQGGFDTEADAITAWNTRALAAAPEGLVEFEGWQDDMAVFGCSGPREESEREARHYLSQYMQDGPVTVYEVTRKEWKP